MAPLALLLGYLADLTLGDPARFHPVAGFGRLAAAGELRLHRPSRRRGTLVTVSLVLGTAAVAEAAARVATVRHPRTGRAAVLAALTWTALGGRSLREAAVEVEQRLERGDLPGGRDALRSLCGRDAQRLGADDLRAGAIESLAENSSDAVVAPLFWAGLLGPAGAAGYRAANTLDAMWGHRSERYEAFGWAAARLDDALNWPAARLTAALACGAAPLVGGARAEAWRAWRRDGRRHPSPNAGPIEAAVAGALGLSLGGPLAYGGRPEDRPRLGTGRAPERGDIARAAKLTRAVCDAGLLVALALAAAREQRWV